jgi:hypothetical protein
MKKILSLMLLYAVVISSALTAKIIETEHFRDILDHVNEDTLVIFDIDDTLFVPKQTLGTDVWFWHRHKEYQAKGLSYEAALEKTLAEWEAIRHLTEVKVVEEGTDAIVESIQNQNIRTMGLTVQGLALATRTVIQLKSLNIDLSRTAPCDHDLYFNNTDPQTGENRHGVLYRQGVMFTSGTSKRTALFRLLDLVDNHPKRIVMIDDKVKYLEDVESGAAVYGIEFIGLRYSFSDERVTSFRPEIAEAQWAHSTLDHLISDEEAEELCIQK